MSFNHASSDKNFYESIAGSNGIFYGLLADDTPLEPIRVFYSYAEADKPLLEKLEKHLSLLKYKGFIASWDKRQIPAGSVWQADIAEYMNKSSVIFLLISSDFLASDTCYSVEMQRAMQRHEDQEALVVPILLRPVDYRNAPFGKLQVLPRNGIPITLWNDQDQAFLEVAEGIRAMLKGKESIPQDKINQLQTIVEALLERDYNAAAQRIALAQPSSGKMLAKLKYLEALVCLRGELPRIHKLSVIKTVEQLLSTASKHDNLYSYTYALAIIKENFAEFNYANRQKAEAEHLKQKAQGLTRLAEDDANIELLSYVQPDLLKD